MKKGTLTIGIVVVLLCIVGFNGCSTYNSMVTASETVESAWAKVEVQYQRRFDLIPNLVETVKGYAKHESETFQNVTNARAGLTDAYNKAKGLEGEDMNQPESFEKYTGAQADLNKALSVYVNAVHEAYPDLKANQQFQDLQVQLEGTENRISTERTNYTNAVKDYNISLRRFPRSIWAGIFGFDPKPQYKAEEAAQSAPKVSF